MIPVSPARSLTDEAKAEDIRVVGAEDIGTSGMGEALPAYIYPYLDRGSTITWPPSFVHGDQPFPLPSESGNGHYCLIGLTMQLEERVILWQEWKPVLTRPLGLEIRPCDDWPRRVLIQVPGTLPGLLEVRMIICKLSSMLKFIVQFHNSVSYTNIVFDSLVLSVGGFTMGMGLW